MQISIKHWGARSLLLAAAVALAAGMSSQQLSALSAAGVGGSVIEALIAEKSLETAAFTVDDIVSLKKSGMSEDTIVMLVHERSFMKNAGTTVYGKDVQPINAASINDLMALKEKGMSDEALRELIRYQSSRTSDDDRRQSWEMLKNMGIVIDGR
ncbi:MAG: hypothetical protein ABIL58_10170 [Pseudomonadota bacterium]